MGACSSSAEEKPSRAKPESTDAPRAAADAAPKDKKPSADVKLVLLGPGESGKSTIFKQMKVIQARDEGKDGFSRDELIGSRGLIFANIVTQMKVGPQQASFETNVPQVLANVALDEGMEFSTEEIKSMAQRLSQAQVQDLELDGAEVGNMMRTLWSEETIKEVYAERDRLFNINDGAG